MGLFLLSLQVLLLLQGAGAAPKAESSPVLWPLLAVVAAVILVGGFLLLRTKR